MAHKYWRVHIEISNICNLQCSFCPSVNRPKKIMEPSFFRRVLKEVAPLTGTVALHLMGDPLVHPRLGEIADICAEFNVRIFLVTNGLLLRDTHCETLLHPAFRQINFSLHSFSDNFAERSPQLYLDRVFDFTELAFERRPTLFINYRLWNLSHPQGQEPENREILHRISARFGTPIPEVDTRLKKNLVLKNYLSLHFDEQFTWPSLQMPLRHSSGTCQGLRSHFGILVDGTVVPCCLDKDGDIALGNILESPLTEILASSRASKIKAGFRTGKLVEELCRRCGFIDRFSNDRAIKALASQS